MSFALRVKLELVLKEFSYQYHTNGALLQVWMPHQEPDGRLSLTTQGMPFAIMGSGDLLALFRWSCSRYKPSCDSADKFCSLLAIWGGRQPVLPSAAELQSAAHTRLNGFDRPVEVKRCQIRSSMFLPVYSCAPGNGTASGRSCNLPVAVFELDQHDAGVDFSIAITILAALLKTEGLAVPDMTGAKAVAERTWTDGGADAGGGAGPQLGDGSPAHSSGGVSAHHGTRRVACLAAHTATTDAASGGSEPGGGLAPGAISYVVIEHGDESDTPDAVPAAVASAQPGQAPAPAEGICMHGEAHALEPCGDCARPAGVDALLSARDQGRRRRESPLQVPQPFPSPLPQLRRPSLPHGAPVPLPPPLQSQRRSLDMRLHAAALEDVLLEQQQQRAALRANRVQVAGIQRVQQMQVPDDDWKPVLSRQRSHPNLQCYVEHQAPQLTSHWAGAGAPEQPVAQLASHWAAAQAAQPVQPRGPWCGECAPRGEEAGCGDDSRARANSGLGASGRSGCGDSGGEDARSSGCSGLPAAALVPMVRSWDRAQEQAAFWPSPPFGTPPPPPMPLGPPYPLARTGSFGKPVGMLLAAASERVRAVLCHGGCFSRSGAHGAWQYAGGDRRLVQLQRGCSLAILWAQLTSSGSGSGSMCTQRESAHLKYALPGSTGVFINLGGEDDVAAMWEEWEEWTQQRPPGSAGKLELFLEEGFHDQGQAAALRFEGGAPREAPAAGGPATPAAVARSLPGSPVLRPQAPHRAASFIFAPRPPLAGGSTASSRGGSPPSTGIGSPGSGPRGGPASPPVTAALWPHTPAQMGIAKPEATTVLRSFAASAQQQAPQQPTQQQAVAAVPRSDVWHAQHGTWAHERSSTAAGGAAGARGDGGSGADAGSPAGGDELVPMLYARTISAPTGTGWPTKLSGGEVRSGAAALAEQAEAGVQSAAENVTEWFDASEQAALSSAANALQPGPASPPASPLGKPPLPPPPGGDAAAPAGDAGVSDAPPATAPAAAHAQHQGTKTQQRLQAAVQGLKARVEIIRPWELHLIRLLGSGAFGEVYLARWHGSEVAVKCLSPRLLNPDGGAGAPAAEAVAELMSESDLLAGLRHPNVVSVFGVVLPPSNLIGDDAGGSLTQTPGGIQTGDMHRWGSVGSLRPPALVTEYLGAGSLRAVLSAGAEWLKGSGMAKVKVMTDTAKGLEYLHTKRICHFDLKSANLLVGFNRAVPVVKVGDFGLSKQRHSTYLTGLDSLRGTLPWMAPEIIRTPSAVTEKCDIYSFGVIMWEVWTGREPFAGVHLHALLHQLSVSNGGLQLPMPGSDDWEGPAELAEPAPGWCSLMQRCWCRDPGQRPSAAQLVEELEAMLQALRRDRRAAPRAGGAAPDAGTV